MLSAVLLILATILAPFIGGGFGELTSGILQILIFGGLFCLIFFNRASVQVKTSPIWTRIYFGLVLVGGIALAVIGHWYSSFGGALMLPAYLALCLFAWFVMAFRPRLPGLIALGIFLAISIISAFLGESVYFGIRQMLMLSACIGAYLLSAHVARDKKMAAAIVWAVMLSAMVICVFGIRDYAISSGGGSAFWKALLGAGDHMRLFGTFINPGFFSGFLVIAIPVTLGVFLVTRARILAILAGIALAVESIAILLTGTKFGIVSALTALFVFFALALATRCFGKVQLKRLAIIAIILLPLMILFSKPLTSRVVKAEAGGSEVHSTAFRKLTWIATANMIKANPVLGVGTGAYDVGYTRYTIAGSTKYAHESYLQIAAESGIIALLAFLAAIFTIAIRSKLGIWRDRDTPIITELNSSSDNGIAWADLIPMGSWRLVRCAIFAALVGSAIRNVVDSDWYIIGIALPFWVLAGVLVSSSGSIEHSITTSRNSVSTWLVMSISIPIMILLSISFGLGDFVVSSDVPPADAQSAAQRFELASTISPLNPAFHRELGKCLVVIPGERDKAIKEFNIAIELAPTLGANYYVRALAAELWNEPQDSIIYLKKSLKCNPKSTQSLMKLADTYRQLGETASYEATLKRLISIENTPYEQVKGTPELVDTTYAYAHAYFGDKYMAEKNYTLSIKEYEAVVERLNRWKSKPDFLKVARFSGLLTEEDEENTRALLSDSYSQLAKAYSAIGDKAKAEEAEKTTK